MAKGVGFIASFDTKEAQKNAINLDREIKNLGNDIMSAFKASSVISWGLAVKEVTTQMISASKAESDYIERTNLLKVAYHDATKEGKELADNADTLITKMKNFYGLDPNELTKSLGIFKQMTNAMGMANDTSALLSENLLKMEEDVSSLYNLDVEVVAKKFQSALAGQTRAVRDLGVDVTKSALQQELFNRGINMNIDDLNRASKSVLIYLAMERQLAEANGDASRTINGVANQTRIFKEQIAIASRQIGALFIPVLKTLLPILNGILMALNAIGEFILGLLGVDVKSLASEFGIANISTDLDGVGSSAVDAGKKVDDLRGKLRGFDKLNVITTPKDKDSGKNTYGVGSGGVNKELLAQMDEYNKKMFEVANKAKEIRDSILQWLGFTIDENGQITGFKLTLGSIVGMLVVGGILYKGVKGILGIFSAIGSILGIGGSVGKGMKGITSALKGTGGVSEQANALKVPKITTVLKGLADIALIVAGLGVLVVAIGGLMQIPGAKYLMSEGLTVIKDLFLGLGSVAIQIGAFSALIVALGFATPVTVLSGMAGFISIIGGLELLILALGAIYQIPAVKEFQSGGKELLFDLADTIGGFAGKIIAGFADKATEGIEHIGTHLSKFMENAKPFFDALSGINESTVNATKSLATAILEMTTANLLDSVTNFFSIFTGETSFEKFGIELEKFAPHFVNYYEIVKDVNGDVVQKSADAGKSLAELVNNLPRSEGVVQWFIGEKNLSVFSEALPEFGKNLKAYSDNVKGLDTNVVTNSANSAKVLAEMAKNLPNQGGIITWFTGDNTLDEFAKKLPDFGRELKKYSDNVRGLDSQVVENSANAGKSLAELANNLPNQGGVASWFAGDNTIDKFGESVAKFGAYFANYYRDIRNIDEGKVNTITKSIGKLVDLSIQIKNEGIANTMKDFSKNLSNSSTGFNNFFSKTNAEDLGYKFGENIGKSMAKAIKQTDFPTIQLKSWGMDTIDYKISARANGGFVDDGEMFLAREAGPELVGRIGNKTAVANNDQIINGIAIGVAKAMSSVKNNQTINIVAEDGGILDYINFKQKQKDRQYGF